MTTTNTPSPIRNMGPYNVADNLYFSPIISSDAPELHRILNINDAVSKGLYSAKMFLPFSREGAEAFTQHHIAWRTKYGFVDCWAIRYESEGPVLGLLGLHAYDHEAEGVPLCYRMGDVGSGSLGHSDEQDCGTKVPMRCGRLGYWLSPEAIGQGIMTRAVEYGLKQLARPLMVYERMHGEAWEDNVASCKVIERVGMQCARSVARYVPKFDETKMCSHYILDV
ncbi:hypothetical protein BGZ82_002417 [Podila clonocystis]|nr:hypothetical protein BGZ82_002417 [Podila clonocystis]